MKVYKVLIEYHNPDENGNLFCEKIIRVYSKASCGKIADNYLTQDRNNLIRSIEVTPF